MARTALVWLVPALVVAGMWLRLEEPRGNGGRVVVVLALALLPALVPRRWLRAAAAVPAALLAGAVAFGLPVRSVLPVTGDPLAGTVRDRAGAGVREFYDVGLPFVPRLHPEMAGLVVLAIFAFTLLIALAVAERRPLPAAAVLAAGAGWPATLLGGAGDLTRGAIILAGVLALLAGLRGARPALRPALLGGLAVLLAAAAASTSPTLARGGLLGWEEWNPYDQRRRVSVDYVWRGNYAGITFPDEATTVFEVEAPREPRYWRSTVLDAFVEDRWDEDLRQTFPVRNGDSDELTLDGTLGDASRTRSQWLRQRIEVGALRDQHLPAASVPVAYDTSGIDDVIYAVGGLALVPDGLARGETYTVWSHSASPPPRALARLPAEYPEELVEQTASFSVWPGFSMPPFGTPNRDELVEELLDSPVLAPYAPLYRTALRVVGEARTPYAAAVGLETWFRRVGGFAYDEQPGVVRGRPPLVGFVIDSRVGYCQHYAGAMALMLRYLGVPARVAAGFTSGTYKRDSARWVVTDFNAHAWVEVWFPRYGWLPFDPTPGRGTFDAAYSNASPSFDAGGAASALLGTGALGLSALERLRREQATGGGSGEVVFAADEESDSRRPGVALLLLFGALALLALAASAKAARRRLRYLTRDPRRIASACRREVAELVVDQRVDIPAGATVSELAALIRDWLGLDARGFVTATSTARYGPPAGAAAAAARARREVRGLRRAIRSRLGLRARLRGVLSLRSLRLQA